MTKNQQLQQVPSIGRVVHYVLPGGPSRGKHRPAIITDVPGDDAVNLVVSVQPDDVERVSAGFSIGHGIVREYALTFFEAGCRQGTEPGTWHWPERV